MKTSMKRDKEGDRGRRGMKEWRGGADVERGGKGGLRRAGKEGEESKG